MTKMVEMQVTGIALDIRSGLPLVILNDKEHNYTLPIWIGHSEAQAIARALEDIETERPMTHDLLSSVFDMLESDIESIEIHTYENSTFFAAINVVDRDDASISIDSRPSDALALALRVSCPIFVAEEILFADTEDSKELTAKEANEAKEFKNFLKDVKASDFTLKND